jgi:hypothetical protein
MKSLGKGCCNGLMKEKANEDVWKKVLKALLE